MNYFRRIFNWFAGIILYQYYKKFKSGACFAFQGGIYEYFYHPYNMTWRNERCVEVPIIKRFVNAYKGKNILEVGNVLSHYFNVNHDIVDKYEKAEGVRNIDVVDYKPLKRYDLIVSISTLEHVGQDEKPKRSMKILDAIKNLNGLLAPRGKMVIIFPIGYNYRLGCLIKDGKIGFTSLFYLKRFSKHCWKEVDKDQVSNIKYDHPFSNGNGLIVGIMGRNIK